MKRFSPAVFYTVIFLIMVEMLVDWVLPWIIPDNIYLHLYLNKSAREKTKNFQNDNDPFLIYDQITGWRNRPNAEHAKWRIDSQGARTTHEVFTQSTRSKFVLFLGNSLVNGGTAVSNQETISAYIEDNSTESINFGTMLYSFDQAYLAYKYLLPEYKANIVVVGIRLPDDIGGLLNQYIPFRIRAEYLMPYFKPRFELLSNDLVMYPPPPKAIYGILFNRSDPFGPVKEHDTFYWNFLVFKHSGLVPLSANVYHLYSRACHLFNSSKGEIDGWTLLRKLMAQMEIEADKRHARVIFMALPNMDSTDRNGWNRFLPDHYGHMVVELEKSGYNVLDVRKVFRESRIPVRDLFFDDNNHYTSTGNRLIAGDLKRIINQLP